MCNDTDNDNNINFSEVGLGRTFNISIIGRAFDKRINFNYDMIIII